MLSSTTTPRCGVCATCSSGSLSRTVPSCRRSIVPSPPRTSGWPSSGAATSSRVFVDAAYLERFNRSGNTFLIPEEDSYRVLVGASYPIYQGGRRKHDVARASSDLQGLQRQRLLTEQLVERRTRTALRRCENSFPRIKFSRQSATAAREGLALVTDRYAEGIDNVTDLLAAQNQSFGSEQLATAATFQFLLDLVELQRALSWFEQDNPAEDQDRFVEQILTSVAERPEDPEDPTR